MSLRVCSNSQRRKELAYKSLLKRLPSTKLFQQSCRGKRIQVQACHSSSQHRTVLDCKNLKQLPPARLFLQQSHSSKRSLARLTCSSFRCCKLLGYNDTHEDNHPQPLHSMSERGLTLHAQRDSWAMSLQSNTRQGWMWLPSSTDKMNAVLVKTQTLSICN